MIFSTPIDIPSSPRKITAAGQLLFVGSCFADSIGRRFAENAFRATVNPFGVMYNPVSVLHTLEKQQELLAKDGTTVVITLGTNHVYREISTGEIVDNCRKRPQRLFREEILSVEECAETLRKCVEMCHGNHVIFTVSPIRYKKYGFHESQLSKATLLLAIDSLKGEASYFPAYEIVLDELRDYRFYATDMIHPSEQAVDYIFERFRETYFSPEAKAFYEEYQPIRQALNHKPINPDSQEYKDFLSEALRRKEELLKKYLLNF